MSDEQLIAKMQEGQMEYGSLLYDRYQRKVFSYFCYMGISKTEAEDLTQDVFFKLIKALSSFDTNRKFKPWIYQIMRNTFRDFSKKKRKIEYQEIDDFPIDMEDHNLELNHQILLKSLGLLPPEQRELVLMAKIQKMKQREIAQILNIEENAVKARVYRAMNTLKKQFGQLKMDYEREERI